MTLKDIVKNIFKKDERFKEMENQRRIEMLLEERSKNSNERELERFHEEERQEFIKDELDRFRQKRREEDRKNTMLQKGNMFAGGDSILKQPNIFNHKATMFGKSQFFK